MAVRQTLPALLFLLLAVELAGEPTSKPPWFPANFTDVIEVNTTEMNSRNSRCSDVRQIFVMKQIGPAQLVPDAEVEGESLNLCPSHKTCCTTKMLDRYKVIAKKDFRNMLQASSSYLKTLIATTATKLCENFVEMVQVSENNTNVLFSNVYKQMDGPASVPVGQLYSDLSAFVAGRDVDLEERVSAFFSALFPVVYHHSINPKLKDFSDDYKECLRETQEELQPFGDIPRRIALHLSRSFHASRVLLQALNLAVEVLNTTEFLDLGEECSSAVVRLTYCAHCQRLVDAKPCHGYCQNVVRGCLANVAELEQPWSDFVTALERLASGMVASYNIEEVLSILDTKISEAIMHAMENGPELSKRVKVACGHPKRATREVADIPLPEHQGKIVSVRSTETTLYMRLQSFVRKLAESKGFYGNLADIMCNDDTLAGRGETLCWNGNSLGEYTKTIAGLGVAAQKYNPELRPPKSRDLAVATLSDKLKHISQLASSKIAPLPQSDSYVVEGSGSGWRYYNSVGDDEDYEENGSGSGDGEESEPKLKKAKSDNDFDFDNSEGLSRDPVVKKTNKASQVSAWTGWHVLVLVVTLMLVRPY